MNAIMYIVLAVIMIATIVIRRDTRELIKRSDKLQKTLNNYIRKEKKHDV